MPLSRSVAPARKVREIPHRKSNRHTAHSTQQQARRVRSPAQTLG